jgi:long-subunit fatty acid transport protein
MRRSTVFAVLFLLTASVPVIQAEKSANGIAFNFSTPGARSLAMGGAFLALADDATAATTNPAGLTNLMVGGPEVAIEFRNWTYTDVTLKNGHFGLAPSDVGIDTLSEPEFGESTSGVNGLSFLSLGYVLPHGVAVALYRHELAHFRAEAESDGFFADLVPSFPLCDGNPLSCRPLRFEGRQVRQDLSITNYGVSAARSVGGKGKWGELSLGLGLSYFTLDSEDRTKFYRSDYFGPDPSDPLNRLPGGYFGPTDFTGDRFDGTFVESGNDAALGFTAGFLWRIGSGERWSLGGVYKNHPSFKTQGRSFDNKGLEERDQRETHGFHVPDIVGLGLAFSTSEGKTKIALDLNRVRYSQRFSDIVRANDIEPFGLTTRDFRLDDASEAHLGLEHVFLAVDSRLVGTFRLGGWWEQAHEPDFLTRPDLKPLFGEKGQDEIHWSGGVGFVVKEDFQIDAAVDISRLVKTVSLSIVKFL